MQEIERKYLLKPAILDFLQDYPSYCKKLSQYYTKVTPELSVRFRRAGDQYYKTIKKGKGAIREEIEKEISRQKYEKNFKKRIGYIIKKKRCFFKVESLEYSVDIYKKPFENLYVLEVEFANEKEYKKFVLPDLLQPYVKKEVTEDEVYKNKNLALFGLPVIRGKAIEELMHKLTGLKEHIMLHCQKVLENGDDEDLHQFRVALRTSVSLLKSCHFMCDEKGCLHYKQVLKEIISVTNRKRDLDVMRMELAELSEDVSHSELKKAFERLYTEIADALERESYRIIAYLQSTHFRESIDAYGQFITGGYRRHEIFYAEYAIKPVCDYVIFTHFIKMKKKIQKINPQNHDVAILHKLRIDFKKMRYILENFQELYLHEEIEDLITDVKKIQKILGRFHDAYQQRVIFENLLEKEEDSEILFLIENIILPKIDTVQEKEIVSIEQKVANFLQDEGIYRQLFIPLMV